MLNEAPQVASQTKPHLTFWGKQKDCLLPRSYQFGPISMQIT